MGSNHAIWWLRRDLRLSDNQALHAALGAVGDAGAVVPLFILDDTLWESPFAGEPRIAFMLAGLRALADDLARRGSRLLVRRGDPAVVLATVSAELNNAPVFAEADVTPYARRRDRAVAAAVPLTLTPGLTIRPSGTVLKRDGDPYTVFTPYRKTWSQAPLPQTDALLPPPNKLNAPPALDSVPLPDTPALPETVSFTAGEAAARRRLDAFLDGAIERYDQQRDRMDRDGTSTLSPYLRWGMLSARTVAAAAATARRQAGSAAARAGVDTWISELVWRDFYHDVLYHFPHVRRGNFRPQYDGIAWDNDEAAFAAWCAGKTGFPVVDAAMRQLNATGWMHNRARMIVASFLTKDLLIDWRWGERYFMQRLADGDIAANNGGWQWAAGTGTDAAPYFRIFNPTTQGEKYDPDGRYIRRWVPELRDVPDRHIHAPDQMGPGRQQAAGCVIGRDYPAPIVDHKAARQRTLAAYKAARG